jgi:hypothetical protein
MHDLIAVITVKIFILAVFVMGMASLGMELYNGALPL